MQEETKEIIEEEQDQELIEFFDLKKIAEKLDDGNTSGIIGDGKGYMIVWDLNIKRLKR